MVMVLLISVPIPSIRKSPFVAVTICHKIVTENSIQMLSTQHAAITKKWTTGSEDTPVEIFPTITNHVVNSIESKSSTGRAFEGSCKRPCNLVNVHESPLAPDIQGFM